MLRMLFEVARFFLVLFVLFILESCFLVACLVRHGSLCRWTGAWSDQEMPNVQLSASRGQEKKSVLAKDPSTLHLRTHLLHSVRTFLTFATSDLLTSLGP